ncbi:DoxX family protein [Actinomadura alba]|uniref:DoxX family membrane protein n=1 Tax=Actinomadura alba TaxID=406431 RepID=A0ABR7LP50_9ACTN|nr:hypothetical protein [Actinomadura alba]MBC6466625.1 hypothetical protein [Actinomadura alba]
MIYLLLGGALLCFRLLGALGVRRFASWSVSAAHALAVMLVVTASAHFVPASVTVMPDHADLVRMVPPIVPFADAMVYLTGVLELLGAAGLVVTTTRWVAGVGLVALFVLLLPANIYASIADVPFHGGEPTPLWLRIPEQALYVGIAVWVVRSSNGAAARRLLHRPRTGPAWPVSASR